MQEEDLLPEGEGAGAIVAPIEDAPIAEEAAEQEAEPAQPITVEDLAGDMGWRPQDQWRGKPEVWKPADEFVRSTVDVNRSLNNKLKGFEDQLSNMARTSASLTERAVAKERQSLLDARHEAFDEGDRDKFNQADKGLAELQSEQQPAQVVPAETQQFLDRNSWFNKDQEATAWALARASELSNQGISAARQIAVVEREAKGVFPEHFSSPAPSKAAPLNSPGNRGSRSAAKGFASLPKDVQSAALGYEKRGVCSKEDYAKEYYEEQGA